MPLMVSLALQMLALALSLALSGPAVLYDMFCIAPFLPT